jgi:hypothetical protein
MWGLGAHTYVTTTYYLPAAKSAIQTTSTVYSNSHGALGKCIKLWNHTCMIPKNLEALCV